MNLYLIGYRCAGKTSVGRLIAHALGWVFVDMDRDLSAEEGVDIQALVDQKGWQYFRRRESRLLERLSRSGEQVIATGGGVVTVPENIDVMQLSGAVVWLQASPACIGERMVADGATPGQRPPLQGDDSLIEIERVLGQRIPLYEQAMHLRVNTDSCSPAEVAEQILKWLKREHREAES